VYYYRVGSDAFGWSATASFKAPQAVAPHTPMSIIVTADMGETYEDGSQWVAAFVRRAPPSRFIVAAPSVRLCPREGLVLHSFVDRLGRHYLFFI
jgi:hypothetical protein